MAQAMRLDAPRAALFGAVLALAGAAASAADEPKAAAAAPPPSVVVAAVVNRDVDKAKRYIGTIKAIQSVDVMARVEGFIDKLAFEQGGMVEVGQLLYQLEQAPFLAALAQAEAALAAAQAQLASAEALLKEKKADFERQSSLLKKGDTSQAMFDQAQAQRDEAAASVQQAQAAEQQAQAQIETAKINLGYTTITSAIKGRIGATTFTQGNLVNTASGTLATVVQIDPMRAVFSIPSADLVRFQQLADKDQDPRARFVPELILPTGQVYSEQGRIAFADNQVNAATGTIAIYADFPNPDQLLLPGQFVTAVLHDAKPTRLPVVPSQAIARTRDGEQVFVVGSDNRVELRTVQTAGSVGTDIAISAGLTVGEIVVVSGLQKVKPGMVVAPVRQSAAGAGPAPAAAGAAAGSGGADKPAPAAGSDAQAKPAVGDGDAK